MQKNNKSYLHVFLLYINVIISYSFKEKMWTFRPHVVDATILEITQDALPIDQTHHFNMFLLNINQFKLRKKKKKKREDNIVF